MSPRRIALCGATLLFLFADASLEAPVSFVPGVLLGLVCAAQAMHARSAVRAMLWCLAAGAVFDAITLAGGYLSVNASAGQPLTRALFRLHITFPGKVLAPMLAFALSLLGLALPVSRSPRGHSLDAVHQALVVTGVWLITAGMLVRWHGLGVIGAEYARGPSLLCLLCVITGTTMLVAGVVADRRLLGWLRAVRRNEQPGWRIEAAAAGRSPDVPFVLGLRTTAEPDGLVMLDTDTGTVPIASVFMGETDRRQLLRGRLRAATVAVALQVTVLPAGILLGVAESLWLMREGG